MDLENLRNLRKKKNITYREIGREIGEKPHKVIRMFLEYQNMPEETYRKILNFLQGA